MGISTSVDVCYKAFECKTFGCGRVEKQTKTEAADERTKEVEREEERKASCDDRDVACHPRDATHRDGHRSS